MSHRFYRSVSLFLLVVPAAFAFLSVGTSPLAAQSCDEPCLVIGPSQIQLPVEHTFLASARIDVQSVRAWSFGICHDPAMLTPVSVAPGFSIGYLDSNGFIDFVEFDFSDSGVAMQAVLCSLPCTPPSYAAWPEVIKIQYEALQIGTTNLEMCDTVQFPPDPPVANVVTDDAGTYPLNSIPRTVEIGDFPPLLPPNPDYVLGFEPIDDGTPGAVRTAISRLGTAPGSTPLAGWSFGICHDPQLVQPVGVAAGASLATMRLGQPVDFFVGQADAEEGVHCGVVICHTACATAPVGADLEILETDYEFFGSPGEVATLEYCNQVSISPVITQTIVVTHNGVAVGATLEPVSIAIAGGGFPLLEPGFLRGDANGSGDVNIADVIAIAMHLFQGSAAPSCSDAADADDNGLLDIADVITLAYALFAAGEPLGQPFPACGADRTLDTLPCAALCP